MEAYDIYQKILHYWQKLCVSPSGVSVKRDYAHVPVHVLINGQLTTVEEVYLDDGKIILRVNHE